ncbi:MAG: ribosomal protein S18-alanine N-acetyltransferase [Hyphomicrobiaceae bacterium]|nr:ribosomal protein S18-alanine N-acetyltransferase [Hyphomicrobiaceae bacterium]
MTNGKNGDGLGQPVAAPPLTPPRVSLLWATQLHAADIARLHSAMFARAWDEAAIMGLLAHPGSVALVATYGAPPSVGGYALAQVAADEAEILSLGVAEDWRRHGVGSQLVDGIKRAASRAGARALFLEVAESNAAARSLYAKAGFSETGRRKGYYIRTESSAEDAVTLKIDLPPPAAR